MYRLFYDETKQHLYQIDPDGRETVIADSSPSMPVYSPDKSKAIYISPLEWECPGSLYLFNLESGDITELISPDDNQNIPKYAIWLSNTTVAYIFGYGLGTVAVGGNVFIINIENKKVKPITKYSGEIQITKLEVTESSLNLFGIRYTDDNYIKFDEFQESVSLEEIEKNI
ncbi:MULTISPECIES: DUF4652 domain-containing protein [Bacillus]|uniref:DUF4652 domain-containing protein n=1 Tax=Bacillus TaxID=1386 RepID=UPI00141F5FBB|nr:MULTISPECIES: DUF4652 domain-containing protein [Bacillus]NUF05491.1 DUF4652 domain-containing protein [Bacillus rugosus]UTL74781.1 DUF4652 domain-containing protein [Bacillus halotolerans]